MVRRSPLKLAESRVIRTFVTPAKDSADSTIRVEVAHIGESKVGYLVGVKSMGGHPESIDLDTFREVNRAVESCVHAHHKRNGKAKAGKGKASNADSSA